MAEFAIATSMAGGMTYAAALAELERDPDRLAGLAFPAISDHRLGVSLTDVEDTIRYDMTAHGRLGDWLLPESVESLRKDAAAALARFTGVTDSRNFIASETPNRLNDHASGRGQRSI
jgi:hypothetical protein